MHPNTFVSKHYVLQPNEVEGYLRGKGCVFQLRNGECVVQKCIWCHDDKGKRENQYKLTVNTTGGHWQCFRCGNKGSWYDLKKRLGDIPDINSMKGHRHANKPVPRLKVEDYQKTVIKEEQEANCKVYAWLQARGINRETAKTYRVGEATYDFPDDNGKYTQKETCITFPWTKISESGEKTCIRIKARSIRDKSCITIRPAGGEWGLFGGHLISPELKQLVLTEGEPDAMAVYQVTGFVACSLPNGARSLPPELLPMLEQFDQIYLWMDADREGQNNIRRFAEKLGLRRTKIVRPLVESGDIPKDANDALKAKIDFTHWIEKADVLENPDIVVFADFRDEVKSEILNKDAVRGIPCLSLPSYNNYMRGFRLGEMSIYTGPTGSGKTTILSQLSLDFALRGVVTLWGSFEIKNPRLSKKMLCQYARRNLEEFPEEFDQWADSFEKLPMFFMNFFGSTPVERIFDTMDYAYYTHDVSHFVLDNLQFMTSGQARGNEIFDIQDQAIKKFRDFASSRNVHVSLVIHPRKSDSDDRPLGMNDIFGTGKAMQETDNIIIIQSQGEQRYLDFKKNRFSGDLGKIPYWFDKETYLIRELTDVEPNVSYIPQQARHKNKAATTFKKLMNGAAAYSRRHQDSGSVRDSG